MKRSNIKHSISFRFNIVAVIGITLIISLFEFYDYQSLRNDLYAELDQKSERLLARLQLSLPLAVWNFQSEQVDKTLESELANEFVTQIRIFERDKRESLLFGKRIDDSGEIHNTEASQALLNLTGEQIIEIPLIYSDEYEGDSQVGIAVVDISDASVKKILHDQVRGLLFKTVLLDIIMIALISFLCRILVINPINSVTKAMQDIADGEGDLTQRLAQTKGEIGLLSEAFNQFVDNIQSVIKMTHQNMGQMLVVSEQLSLTAEATNDKVMEQGSEIELVATATHEMSVSSEEVSRNAEEAATCASNGAQSVEEAQRILAMTIDSIHTLANEIESGEAAVAKVRSDVTGISSVLDVIGSIAEQTNLLALNAAIEAARAGEQGRGFAVVADEVRSLAKRTQESTEEVYNMLNLLQNGADDAVKEIVSAKQQSEKTVSEANGAGSSLNAVIDGISVINDMNTQIAQAVGEQSSVIADISGSLTKIASLSEQTAHDAKDTSDSSESVLDLSTQVQSLLGRFKT